MKTILIVDDKIFVRLLLEATLDDGSFRFQFADNGPDALRMARTLEAFLILLDIGLADSKMDGLEVCRELKADPATADILIALISGYGEPADIEAGLAAGADAYFTKPFSPMAILEWLEGRPSTLPGVAGQATGKRLERWPPVPTKRPPSRDDILVDDNLVPNRRARKRKPK
jgi:CheY-like chemotaxis protein